jgi:hypothetical protein
MFWLYGAADERQKPPQRCFLLLLKEFEQSIALLNFFGTQNDPEKFQGECLLKILKQ